MNWVWLVLNKKYKKNIFEKKQFAFELCWETLRSFDKWNDKLEEMKAKKNTPADNNKKGKGKAPAVSNVGQEGDNGESSTAQSTNKRPDGNKKEKARTELKRDFDEAMKNQAAFLEETRKKSRYLEQLVAVEKRKAKDDRKERDEKIMAVDPSQLDPVRRQFFEIRQKQILERLLAGGAEDEEDEEDDGEEDEKFEEENEEVEE
ncbi:No apical meristem-associated C-terminal domain-containing protein, partial [Zychaea mexicana]